MQWIMVYITRYWISTLHKTYSRDYNGLSFLHQFPDVPDVADGLSLFVISANRKGCFADEHTVVGTLIRLLVASHR